MRHLAFVSVFFLALSVCLPAQRLIGIDAGSGELVEIDVHTGRATLIGGAGFSLYVWSSMAADGQGHIYVGGSWLAGNRTEIYEVDPHTGRKTFVCQTDVFAIHALAFDRDDVLYAITTDSSRLTDPMHLRTVDLATGQTTIIGVTGVFRTTTMDWYGDTLWIWDIDLGLMTLDARTAQPTDVNPGFVGVPWGPQMVFRPDGTLYLQIGSLMVVDPQTGIPGHVGYDQWLGSIGAIEWLDGPNPAPPALGVRGRRGDLMSAHATGMTPYGKVLFAWSVGAGGPTVIPPSRPCAGTLLELRDPPTLAFLTLADFQGRAHTPTRLAPWFRKGRVHLQALDLTSCRTTNPLQVMY